jgi:hypothetical protein
MPMKVAAPATQLKKMTLNQRSSMGGNSSL